jgi:hypothetical protein
MGEAMTTLQGLVIPLADLDQAIIYAKATLAVATDNHRDGIEKYLEQLIEIRDLEALIQ